jgi:hypothetical protein
MQLAAQREKRFTRRPLNRSGVAHCQRKATDDDARLAQRAAAAASAARMPLSIYNLFKASLLVLNALAVLHEGRFLKHYQLDSAAANGTADLGAGEPGAARVQVAGLLRFARGLRWPLVAVNLLVVLIELLFG